jgi:eukaryotic-like serine/threonine-protein kinase
VRELRPGLPEALAMVLALALEKKPERRYANGEDMAQDLEVVLAQLDPAAVADVTDFTATDIPTEPGAFDGTQRMERRS